MSSSEDEGEGKPLLSSAAHQREELSDDDELWLLDSRPNVRGVTQRRRPGLARLAMQSYDAANELVQMEVRDHESASSATRRRSAAAHPGRTASTRSAKSESFVSSFDDKSKSVYSSLPERHSATSGRLLTLIASTGTALQSECSTQIRNMAPGFTYSDMIQHLLVSGETLVTSQGKHLVYSRIVLHNEKGEEYRHLPRGQAVLTNKRLLFLSCEHMKKATLEETVGVHSPRYVLLAKEGDATVYVPVPLASLKAVELVSFTVSAHAAEIAQMPACCSGIFCCFQACFPGIASSWKSGNIARERHVQRIIRIGLLMPPWGERTTAELHLHPAFSVALATEFLTALQKHAMGIQT